MDGEEERGSLGRPEEQQEEPHAPTVRRTPRTPCEQRPVRQLTAAAEIRLPAPRRETRRLSHAMPLRDCNVLIRTLARRGSFSRVMAVYYDLRARGLAADSYTYPFVLMAISTMKLSIEGRKVHADLNQTVIRIRRPGSLRSRPCRTSFLASSSPAKKKPPRCDVRRCCPATAVLPLSSRSVDLHDHTVSNNDFEGQAFI